MYFHCVSIHVDPPRAKRLALTDAYDGALAEVTNRTAATFGATFVGLHTETASRFVTFSPVAHLRDGQGRFIMPSDPADHLYEADGKPLPNAMRRWVKGIVVNASGRRADEHAYFSISEETYRAIANKIGEWEFDPPQYNTISSNCVKFALTVLATADIALSAEGLPPAAARLRRPEDIGAALRNLGSGDGVLRVTKPMLIFERSPS